jgi:hypothetical protein
MTWAPRDDLESALYALVSADMLPSAGIPDETWAGNPPIAPCPVCGRPTVAGWWVIDGETGQWDAVPFDPGPCLRCRAIVLSATAGVV